MFPAHGTPTGATPRGCWWRSRSCYLMTPALGLFYGGMVRSKGVLNMMMMCLTSIPIIVDRVGDVRILAGVR